MTEQEARMLERRIEDALDGNEIGLLRAEESPVISGHWGVTLILTSRVDWPVLKQAAISQGIGDDEAAEMYVAASYEEDWNEA